MRISTSRQIHISSDRGWADYTQRGGNSVWKCNPGSNASSGFFNNNSELKPVMTDNEMMLLILKYGGES